MLQNIINWGKFLIDPIWWFQLHVADSFRYKSSDEIQICVKVKKIYYLSHIFSHTPQQKLQVLLCKLQTLSIYTLWYCVMKGLMQHEGGGGLIEQLAVPWYRQNWTTFEEWRTEGLFLALVVVTVGFRVQWTPKRTRRATYFLFCMRWGMQR